MFVLQHNKVGIWNRRGVWHWSCLNGPTTYENSSVCGTIIQNLVSTGHTVQHRMNWLWSSTSWMYCGESGGGCWGLGEVYNYSASSSHCLLWHNRSYGWHYTSCHQEQDWMEQRIRLHWDVCAPDQVQILPLSDFHDWSEYDFSTNSSFLQNVAIISDVAQGNGYWSWGYDIIQDPLLRDISEVYSEYILCQTSMFAGHQIWKDTPQQSFLFCNGFKSWSIMI